LGYVTVVAFVTFGVLMYFVNQYILLKTAKQGIAPQRPEELAIVVE